MLELLTYSLLGLGAAIVVSGAVFVVGRTIGAAAMLEGTSELRTRLSELEIVFAAFAEQYEISNTRSAAKIGKLRRKVERLEDGDDGDDEEGEAPPVVAPAPPQLVTGSDVLRLARQKGIV